MNRIFISSFRGSIVSTKALHRNLPCINQKFFSSHKTQKNLTINEKETNKLSEIDLSSKPIPKVMPSSCGDKIEEDDEDELEEMEEMLVPGPSLNQKEWGGPTRGGRRPEPTRFGDWERKGRISDF